MNKRNTAFGIAVLFALALGAFSAASASASGATAFTCVKDEGGSLFGPHCLGASTGDNTKYKHVAIEPEVQTTGTATNANTASGTTASTPAVLKSVTSGVVTTIECSEVHGEGVFENKTTVKGTGEMFGHAEGKLHYTGCKVTAPAGKGCVVANEGTITTNQLTGRTVGSGGSVIIEPKEPSTFVEIKIEGCSVSALNNTFPVKGSVEAKTNGATLTSTHAEVTTQGKLTFGGQKAGLEGALTLKAHKFPKEGEEVEVTKPLSVTATP